MGPPTAISPASYSSNVVVTNSTAPRGKCRAAVAIMDGEGSTAMITKPEPTSCRVAPSYAEFSSFSIIPREGCLPANGFHVPHFKHKTWRCALIYWMGGSVCSGKSSVASLLGTNSGAVVYNYDAAERDHLERMGRSSQIIDRIEDPEMRRQAHDERWLSRPPAEMAGRTIRSWTQRFPLVLEDLETLSGERIIAHGAGLFPELVANQVTDQSQSVFLIGTPEFIRWARRRRGMGAPAMTSDPDFASENIIARDCLMAVRVRNQAAELGLTTKTVDGTEPVEEVAERVAQVFGWS